VANSKIYCNSLQHQKFKFFANRKYKKVKGRKYNGSCELLGKEFGFFESPTTNIFVSIL